jgi:hypothetical protein
MWELMGQTPPEGKLSADDPQLAASTRLTELYDRHGRDVLAYALRRASPDDAADAVADTFLVAWRRLAEVPAEPEARLWLYGVARSSHRVSDPQALAPSLLAKEERGSGAESGAERAFEARIAVVDIRCQYRTGYAETEVRLQQRFATVQTARYEEVLERVLDVIHGAREKAHGILGG